MRALEKGRELDCDAMIMDLEDAVSPAQKVQARENIRSVLSTGAYAHRLIAVRINALDTEWGEGDLEMALSIAADAIVLPKVESAAAIQSVAGQISKNSKIWAMIETPLGVLNVREIAKAHAQLDCLVMGTSDLARELHCLHTADRLPFLTSFGLCILAARAYGRSILDGVHLDLDDDEGFEASCRQGRALGFDGKTLIHPKTIDTANRAYSPTEKELEDAHKVIAAHREAEQNGSGVVVVNGKLIENLHVEIAERLLQQDRAIRQR
mgnify:FL=1